MFSPLPLGHTHVNAGANHLLVLSEEVVCSRRSSDTLLTSRKTLLCSRSSSSHSTGLVSESLDMEGPSKHTNKLDIHIWRILGTVQQVLAILYYPIDVIRSVHTSLLTIREIALKHLAKQSPSQKSC
jgi:hypothetical protein